MMDGLVLEVPDWLQNALTASFPSVMLVDAERYEQAQLVANELWIQCHAFVNLLHIPSSTLYWTAGQEAFTDAYSAAHSVGYLLFLTLRPIVLCLYWMMYAFTYHVVYKIILVQGLYHHGLSQAKEGCMAFWRFQSGLTRQQCMMEAAGLVALYSLYKLQQFLKRRRYLYKMHLWMDRTKRGMVKSYRGVVHRIATLSVGLAVMTPHALLCGVAVAGKVLLPSVVSRLCESQGVRDILSWWYPLICTLLMLLDEEESDDNTKQQNTQSSSTTTPTPPTTRTAASVDKENSAPSKSTSSSSKKKKNATSTPTPSSARRKGGGRGGDPQQQLHSPFPRTTPKSSNSNSTPRWNRTTPSSNTPLSTGCSTYHSPHTKQQRARRRRRQSLATPLRIITQQHQQHQDSPAQQQAAILWTLQEQQADWLRFWMVRGALEASKVLLAWLVPTWLHPTLFHLEVLFYVWIYVMPYLQPESMMIGGRELPEGRPLQVLCTHLVTPAVESLHTVISDAVPQHLWEQYVVQNLRRVLDVCQLLRLVRPETATHLLHWTEEGRALVLPAVTLFMPYFITAYGVVYVQFALSMAKSAAAIALFTTSSSTNVKKDQQQQQPQSELQRWLSYWVFHCMLVAVLSRLYGILWWIPFSTHAIFVVWCALSIPRNIDFLYHFMLDELRTFGILPPKPGTDDDNAAAVVDWQATKTAKFAQWIWERLPKSNEVDDRGSNDHGDDVLASFNSQNSQDGDDGIHTPTAQDEPPMDSGTGDDDDGNNTGQNDDPLSMGTGAESEQEDDDDDVVHMDDDDDDDYYIPSPAKANNAAKSSTFATNTITTGSTTSALQRNTRRRKPRLY